MLQDAVDIVRRVGLLLDDPSNSVFTQDYILPWIDQQYDLMDTKLELMGMQYTEGIAVIPLNSGTSDLTPYLADGQPLAYMKYPKRVKWKLTGQPDVSYLDSIETDALDEVVPNWIGNTEYVFTDGAIQVTPSGVATTVKVYFDQMSTNIYDPQANVIRGTASLLSLDVAAQIAEIRGMTLAPSLMMKFTKAFDDFAGVLSKQRQGKRNLVPRIHSTARRAGPPAGYM